MFSLGLAAIGKWSFRCYDRFGNLKWIELIKNTITNECLNDNLDVYLNGGTQSSDWYVLLFSSNSTPAVTWTYAAIGTDFTEFTDYDELTRVTWSPASPSGQSITNSASPAEFTASAGVDTSLYGAGMVNVSTKGDNASPAGKLFCATRFGSTRPYTAAEVIKIVYTVNAANA